MNRGSQLLKSAKGAARTYRPSQEPAAAHSVLREILKSAKGAARTSRRIRNGFAPHSVLREFLRSAKGAAGTSRRTRNGFAPHSVLREVLKRLDQVAHALVRASAPATSLTARLALGALLASLVLLPSRPALAAATPTPEAILDRFVEVTGGKAAYQKRKSEVVHGTIEFAALGLKGTVVEYFEEPGKFYMAMNLAGIGKIESGLTDGVAWENSLLQGARVKTGEEKAQAVREAALNIFEHWREAYPKAESAGEEMVDGEPCYKVILTPDQSKPETMFFEKKSGLLRKTTVVAASPLGDVTAESISTEYRRFEDILAPSKVTERVAGQEFTITIESMQSNQEIPPEKFALPDEVKALLEKQQDSPAKQKN